MQGVWATGRPTLLLLLLLLSRVAALHPGELFPFGESWGDQLLQEGDDESSAAVKLAIPLRFYEAQFSNLYVGTNGIISTQDFPRETQYVDDDFPTDFPAIAPFLADIDTTRGRGRILYRQDTSSVVLNLAAHYVRSGFPRLTARFVPTHAFLATWDHVGAYEEVTRGAPPSGERNTFQAVLAYDESDTYALFLYPTNGLHFFGTRPKESYNVQLELPARVGFCQGETDDLKTEGPYFSLTSTEQSVKNLYQLSNVGIPGVWAFHIGSATPLDNVRPATIGGNFSKAPLSSAPLEQTSRRTAALGSDYTEDNLDYYDENEEEVDYPPRGAGAAGDGRGAVEVSFHSEVGSKASEGATSPPDSEVASLLPYATPSDFPSYSEPESATWYPRTKAETLLGKTDAPDLNGHVERPEQTESRRAASPERARESQDPSLEAPPPYPEHGPVEPYPDGGAVPSEMDLPFAHPDPVRQRYRPPGFENNAAHRETCERNHGQCSQHAFCTDYTTGFCCHCQSSFYGNGKHCLPEGVPLRVNGKVSGYLQVGPTPVHFTDADLHAYVVGNDGRAYTAISDIPQPAAQALLPLTPIGGLFGWLFALAKPGSENGFSIAGEWGAWEGWCSTLLLLPLLQMFSGAGPRPLSKGGALVLNAPELRLPGFLWE